MSGGFFRGTSAEQDTRFSNKHAKLLKSQKFAPELDHLADMTKIKMDVMRPWIAKRATEFLGFEDEVLINFIYGLLEGKNVNGKEIQISLTGFMEKNTAKFMKELWSLLISAQNNASGVPQQFLDAKEEETRKKKAESDKIANEIQKKCEKENRDVDHLRPKKMACDFDISRDAVAAALLPGSRPVISNTSPVCIDDARDTTHRNGFNRRKSRTSPMHSVSPEVHKNSISSGGCDSPRRCYRIPRRQSGREHNSPSRFNSRHSTEHSHPYSDHSSLSPCIVRNTNSSSGGRPSSRIRYRHSSPRHKSNTSVRCISPSNSPVSHNLHSPCSHGSSPIRHMSSSFTRHGSPVHYDSPSSPFYRRSLSSIRNRYPSPMHCRSMSPIHRISPFHNRHRHQSSIGQRFSFRHRSSIRRKYQSPVNRRSPFLSRHISPSPFNHRSPSSVKCKKHYRYPSSKCHSSPPRRHRSPSLSPREVSGSPVLHGVYMNGHRVSPSCSHLSQSLYGSSMSPIEQEFSPRRTMSHKKSPLVQEKSLCFNHDHVVVDGLVPMHKECKIGTTTPHKSLNSPQKDSEGIKYSYKKISPSYISPDMPARMTEGTTIQRKLIRGGDTENTLPIKSLDRIECSEKTVESSKHRKCEVEKCGDRSWESESDSEGSVGLRETGRGQKRHDKKRDRKKRIDYSGSEDSEEERKEAKRRRKMARKEDRRRRREERRHRKKEKRVEKQGKKRSLEKRGSGGEVHRRDDDCEEERRLEVELRKKAIESLRAKKKAINL